MLGKVHKSSLALVPHAAGWQRIQLLRAFRDKSFARWPPHINLLYPFVPDEGAVFEEAAHRARNAVAALTPFELRLSHVGMFEHSRTSFTLYLCPEEEAQLMLLQAALEQAFPHCSDLSSDPQRGIERFTPHLSLGQVRGSKAEALQTQAELQAAWAEPLVLRVDEVVLMSREGFLSPFSVRYAVPLGGAQAGSQAEQGRLSEPARVDVPYIATVGRADPAGPSSTAPGTDPQQGRERFGLGGAPQPDAFAPSASSSSAGAGAGGGSAGAAVQAAWCFAYGANMSAAKLARRGVRPLRSLPAALPGWRLAFNCPGAMGNIVPCASQQQQPQQLQQPHADGGASSTGREDGGPMPCGVHGVLHLLSPEDVTRLLLEEHEYLPVEVEVVPYNAAQDGGGGAGAATSWQAPALGAGAVGCAAGTVRALAFVGAPEREIQDGLAPTSRYLELVRAGARERGLAPAYLGALDALRALPDSQPRGDAYYTSAASGARLPALPKIRTGSEGGRGRGRGRGGGRGRGPGVGSGSS